MGRLKEALDILHVMGQRGIRADSYTYASLLQDCVNGKTLLEGKLLHAHMAHSGFSPDVFVGTKLVIMYANCGSLVDARRVLDGMSERNVVSWSAMIAAYAKNGFNEEALTLFNQMQRTRTRPNQFTFTGVLTACANLADLEHGKKVHEQISRAGLRSDIFVENALVDVYAKCGLVEDAHQLFDKMPERDVVSWTTIVAGYVQKGHVGEALKLFQKMPERNVVSWTVMIGGYAKLGCVDEALKLFQKMPERNVVTWTAMIAGYAQNGQSSVALNLFREMQLSGVKPNSVTFASVLPACADLASLNHGKEIHEGVIKVGLQSDVFVSNALVDMYAKCGNLDSACQVFDKMPERDVVSWNAMIVGYAMHGHGKEALQVFGRMQHSSKRPNHVTLMGVLSACCHAGLVDDGLQYFNQMNRDYHITPTIEHYCCIVDLLGRAGRLDEAEDFIHKMPIKPNSAVWGSLLGACRIHANIELGERAAECLFDTDPRSVAHYVLLSNIYGAVGRWNEVEKLFKMMKDRMVGKKPGCSWIEINDKVYAFLVGGKSQLQTV